MQERGGRARPRSTVIRVDGLCRRGAGPPGSNHRRGTVSVGSRPDPSGFARARGVCGGAGSVIRGCGQRRRSDRTAGASAFEPCCVSWRIRGKSPLGESINYMTIYRWARVPARCGSSTSSPASWGGSACVAGQRSYSPGRPRSAGTGSTRRRYACNGGPGAVRPSRSTPRRRTRSPAGRFRLNARSHVRRLRTGSVRCLSVVFHGAVRNRRASGFRSSSNGRLGVRDGRFKHGTPAVEV